MPTKKEEDELYEKLVEFKTEKEYLLKIYESVDSLIRSGYDGQFIGEEVRDIFSSVNEYKIWKKRGK